MHLAWRSPTASQQLTMHASGERLSPKKSAVRRSFSRCTRVLARVPSCVKTRKSKSHQHPLSEFQYNGWSERITRRTFLQQYSRVVLSILIVQSVVQYHSTSFDTSALPSMRWQRLAAFTACASCRTWRTLLLVFHDGAGRSRPTFLQ